MRDGHPKTIELAMKALSKLHFVALAGFYQEVGPALSP